MADILIRGMEMPKKDEILVFDEWHGKVYARSTANTGTRRYEVVSLPEGHGRLIDADALIDALETQDYSCAPDTLEDWTPQDMTVAEIADITHAPTIVPAEGGTEECSEN